MSAYRSLLAQLAKENFALLRALLLFLREVASQASRVNMSSSSLAIVFAPNVFASPPAALPSMPAGPSASGPGSALVGASATGSSMMHVSLSLAGASLDSSLRSGAGVSGGGGGGIGTLASMSATSGFLALSLQNLHNQLFQQFIDYFPLIFGSSSSQPATSQVFLYLYSSLLSLFLSSVSQ